jgi:VWFA-related protein
MPRTLVAAAALLLTTAAGGVLQAQAEHESGVVFKSGVSLARVDVQVLDRNRRPITNLRKDDFELEVNGADVPIVSFGAEEVPLDVIILLDVSGSMRPHVELIARATRSALLTLGRKDRVAILVFDRRTRVSMPFQQDHDQIVSGMNRVLANETFNGGTDITRAFYDSIKYMNANARPEARRAIVILTDDETERNRDIRGIGNALEEGGIVVSALIADNAMGWRGGRGSRTGGGTIGTSWPDIIFGPSGRRGGKDSSWGPRG